jgi:hypothetical protein
MLLKFLRRGIVANEVFEDRQDMLTVLNDSLQHGAKLRSTHRFLIPLRQNSRGNLYVPPQLVGRMAAQEQAIKKSRLPLRELKVQQRLFHRICKRCHVETAVYRFQCLRQGHTNEKAHIGCLKEPYGTRKREYKSRVVFPVSTVLSSTALQLSNGKRVLYYENNDWGVPGLPFRAQSDRTCLRNG